MLMEEKIVKEFIKSMKMKDMKASELAYLIDENQKDLIDFYVKEGHRVKNADVVNKLYEKMLNPKFVKALKKIIKNEESNGLDAGFVVIINGFIEKNYKNENMNDDLIASYSEIINKVLKGRIKKVNKKVNIDPDIIKELLVIVPDVGYVSDEKFTGIYSQRMLRKLYVISSEKEIGLTKTKEIKKLFKALLGEKVLDLIAINILLEKKEYMKNFNDNQIAIWNLFTDFALELINNEDKKHIVELLEYYCNRRRADANKDRDAARRISLVNIDEEKYPNLAKGIKKFVKNGKESLTKYL